MITLLLFGCGGKAIPEQRPAGPVALTVLHTNDIHSHFDPEPADWLEGKPLIGGFVRLEQEVRAIREARGPSRTLLLDGGDQLTGTPLTEVEVNGSFGGAMHALFDAVGYDAWVVGNHEFDKGLANAMAYTASHPIVPLSANLLDLDRQPLLPRQQTSKVVVVEGVRVAIIGATTERLAGLMNKADFAKVTVVPEVEAVQAEVTRLDPVSDLIVLLTHIGLESDKRLADNVSGIDLIVGGHSHTRLTNAVRVKDTWIVQAGSYTRALGVVDLVVENDAISTFNYELRDLLPETATVPANKALETLVASQRESIDKLYGEQVSTAPALLGRSYNHESALGRWITDALREYTGADVAFYNGGGLRADIPPGPVTRLTLFQCFPFRNAVMRFNLTGQELLDIVLKNVAADADKQRGFISASGLTWTWRRNTGAPEIVSVWVNSQPLDLARSYVVVSSSYVAEQWQKHLGAEPKNLENLGYDDLEVAVAHARKGPVQDSGQSRGVELK